MSNLITLHIPMDRSVKQRLDEKAKRLGFDSTQAYIRVWAQAEADGRTVDFDEDDWGQPTPEAAARLNKWAEEAIRDSKAGKLKSYSTVEEFMADLRHDQAA
jgi:hypothetical protein